MKHFVVSVAILSGTVGAVADGTLREVSLAPEDCRRLVQHVPSTSVEASPKDAYGRPVVPADEHNGFQPPVIDLWIETPEIVRDRWRTEPVLMKLTLDLATGELSSNGRPVPGLTSVDLVNSCVGKAAD